MCWVSQGAGKVHTAEAQVQVTEAHYTGTDSVFCAREVGEVAGEVTWWPGALSSPLLASPRLLCPPLSLLHCCQAGTWPLGLLG